MPGFIGSAPADNRAILILQHSRGPAGASRFGVLSPLRACAREAKLIIVSMRRVQDTAMALRHAPGVPVVTRVFEASDAEWIAQLGGTPILNPHAAVETFMEWFEKSGKTVPARSTPGPGKS